MLFQEHKMNQVELNKTVEIIALHGQHIDENTLIQASVDVSSYPAILPLHCLLIHSTIL